MGKYISLRKSKVVQALENDRMIPELIKSLELK